MLLCCLGCCANVLHLPVTFNGGHYLTIVCTLACLSMSVLWRIWVGLRELLHSLWVCPCQIVFFFASAFSLHEVLLRLLTMHLALKIFKGIHHACSSQSVSHVIKWCFPHHPTASFCPLACSSKWCLCVRTSIAYQCPWVV